MDVFLNWEWDRGMNSRLPPTHERAPSAIAGIIPHDLELRCKLVEKDRAGAVSDAKMERSVAGEKESCERRKVVREGKVRGDVVREVKLPLHYVLRPQGCFMDLTNTASVEEAQRTFQKASTINLQFHE